MTQSTLQSSRRAFLKTGAAGVMTLGVGGMAQAATTAKALPKWDKEFDVIVVGSGLAGYCAGITAAELGRKTVILEKMAVPGGSSVISGGTFAACNTKRQQKEGVKDSVELYVKDVLKAGGRLNVPELVQTMCEQSNEAFEFLVERGAQYNEELRKVAGHTVKRCFQPLYNNGLSVIQPLHRHYLKLKNTSLQLRTKVDEIIRDQKGRAVGVKVREAYIFDPESKADDRLNKTGVVKFYKAKRGLVFATGGFSRDFEFRQREFPQYNKVPSTVSCGATAGALKLMMKAGARSIHLAHVRFAISIGFEDIEKGILVDQRTGKRFREVSNEIHCLWGNFHPGQFRERIVGFGNVSCLLGDSHFRFQMRGDVFEFDAVLREFHQKLGKGLGIFQAAACALQKKSGGV